jgi:hypothetical protein
MGILKLALAALCAAVLVSPAHSDCVDYSEARAKRAAAALEAKPPTPSSLGLPSFDGLKLDAQRTAGDPECDGTVIKSYFFTLDVPQAEFIGKLYPYIKRRTSVDGMNREWFRNPRASDTFVLTSGVELDVGVTGGIVSSVRVTPPAQVLPLVEEQQPYTVDNIVEGRPWPGTSKEFVQVNGPAAAPATASATASAPAPTPAKTETPGCATTADGESETSAVGQEVGGRILGGGYGRNVGGAIGGLFGGGKKKSEDPTKPGC